MRSPEGAEDLIWETITAREQALRCISTEEHNMCCVSAQIRLQCEAIVMADMHLVSNLGFISEDISKACNPPNQTLHRFVFTLADGKKNSAQ